MMNAIVVLIHRPLSREQYEDDDRIPIDNLE